MLKKFFKKITGLQALEDAKAQAEKERTEVLARVEEAKAQEEQAKRAEEQAKMTPKERANALGEPWVAVLDTKVNKENVRNGFFELDWNEQFVLQLKQAGYGFDGDPDEEIVDRWFRDLAKNMLADSGYDPERNGSMGYINVSKLGGGKASVE
jgi:hypothetical protein